MSSELSNDNKDNSNNLNENSGKMKKRGTKEEVFHGLAIQTGGGLRKADLIQNKRGKIVSSKRYEQGKKQFKNIEKYINDRKAKKEIKEEDQEIEEVSAKPEEIHIKEEQEKINQLKQEEEKLRIQANQANARSDNNKLSEINSNLSKVSQEIKLKEDAVQEEKGGEPIAPIKVVKKRGRKIKDMPQAIEEIKLNQ